MITAEDGREKKGGRAVNRESEQQRYLARAGSRGEGVLILCMPYCSSTIDNVSSKRRRTVPTAPIEGREEGASSQEVIELLSLQSPARSCCKRRSAKHRTV
ncbi:unnamed protein product, partial [Ectocarpus sp. 12 AP-2014]